MRSLSLAVRSASVVTFAAALVASTAPVFTDRSRRVRATTKRFVSPVLACLIVGGVQGRAAEVSRIELLPLQTVTLTEEQFLTGSRDGRPVTIAVELRLPSTAAARVPAVILLHGSGGANTRDDRWSRDLNDLGVATLLVDSFSGRGSSARSPIRVSSVSCRESSTRIVHSSCSRSTRVSTRHASVFSAAPAARCQRSTPASSDSNACMRRRARTSPSTCRSTRRVPEPTSTTPTWWSDRFGSFTVRLTMLRLWRNVSPT